MPPKRILVVDDDAQVSATIQENLKECGYAVEASSSEICMDFLQKKGTPDLIITDIVMPYKDGLELIVEIRQRYPAVKLLAISGGGRSWGGDYLAMSKKLGCDAVLPKPFELPELEETVRSLVG